MTRYSVIPASAARWCSRARMSSGVYDFRLR
jgi:hypothetical protein